MNNMTDEENTAYFEVENLAFDLNFRSINQDEIKQGNNIYKLLDLLKKLQKENEELKIDNNKQWKERCRLTFELQETEDRLSKIELQLLEEE